MENTFYRICNTGNTIIIYQKTSIILHMNAGRQMHTENGNCEKYAEYGKCCTKDLSDDKRKKACCESSTLFGEHNYSAT